MLSKPSCVHRESKQTTENRGGVPSRARPHSNAAGDRDALDGSGSATAPGKSPLATSCSVDSCLGLVLLAKATSSHVSVLSLQKAIAFSISTTVVLVLQLQIVDLLHILSNKRERFGRNSIDARSP